MLAKRAWISLGVDISAHSGVTPSALKAEEKERATQRSLSRADDERRLGGGGEVKDKKR